MVLYPNGAKQSAKGLAKKPLGLLSTSGLPSIVKILQARAATMAIQEWTKLHTEITLPFMSGIYA